MGFFFTDITKTENYPINHQIRGQIQDIDHLNLAGCTIHLLRVQCNVGTQ